MAYSASEADYSLATRELEDDTAEVMECQICGAGIQFDRHGYPTTDEEVGEFWDKDKNESLYGHADCGFGAGLDLA